MRHMRTCARGDEGRVWSVRRWTTETSYLRSLCDAGACNLALVVARIFVMRAFAAVSRELSTCRQDGLFALRVDSTYRNTVRGLAAVTESVAMRRLRSQEERAPVRARRTRYVYAIGALTRTHLIYTALLDRARPVGQ